MFFTAFVLGAGVGCKSNSIASTTNNTGSGLIGPNGGVVTLGDGTEVRIPAGALRMDTQITISVADMYPVISTEYTFVSKVYSFEPHGLKFDTASIIEIPFDGAGKSNLVAIHADPNGSWTQVPATIGLASAEISAPSFSFYAVASTTQSEAGGPSCSGRGPDNGAPKATTVSGFTGSLPLNPPSTLDLMTMTDGYAITGAGGVQLVFTPYTGACGYYENQVYKRGAIGALITVGGLATQTYSGTNIAARVDGVGTNVPQGACNLGGSSSSPITTTGSGVTITAIDATHVAGSFSFDPKTGAGPITGMFDVPVCTVRSGLSPAQCCE